jgi:hypothetical protein
METNEYIKYMEINNIPYTIDTSPNQETTNRTKVVIETIENKEKLWYHMDSIITKKGYKVDLYGEVK